MENKYKNGKNYQIVDIGYNRCYIGSTIQPLSKRYEHHRHTYKAKSSCRSSQLFKEFGIDNCKIELLENYPCNSKEELNAREGYYIRITDCVNKYVMGRTKAEGDKIYYENNKEQLKERMK